MKIVVDAYGSDLGPTEAVKASIDALKLFDDIKIILCGKKEELNFLLDKFSYDKNKIEIVDCDQVILNDEIPTEAIKNKPNSSLVKAFEALKGENVAGMVSCGSTGAVLAGAFLKVGRIKGISRPALCPIVPSKDNSKVLLIDSGANVDCKPLNICHFALMASIYSKILFDIDKPRVSLLNIGTEDKKGNEFSQQCFKELSKMPLNFVGNMEARDFMSGKYDVVVADGFYGNILLKSVEGTAIFLMNILKNEIKSSFKSKLGAFLMKGSLLKLKNTLNYNNYGGAAFLGVKKIIIKGHGASESSAFLKSIEHVRKLHLNNFCEIIEAEVSKMGEFLNV